MLRGQPPPPHPNASNGRPQVSLVHSSDSVRSVANATPISSSTPFAPAPKMSKPPIRVVAPPTRMPHASATLGSAPMHAAQSFRPQQQQPASMILPTMSVPPMAGRSYKELTEYAEQQRKQIEANRRDEERRQTIRAQSTRDATQRVQNMRREVAEEEGELRRLSELERETKSMQIRNEDKSKELSTLTGSLKEQQKELRAAAGRVEALRRQLEDIYRRRQVASTAALAEHRKMQQENQQQQQMMNRSHERVPSGSEVVRPRASVEPFHVVVPKPEQDVQVEKSTVGEDLIDSPASTKLSVPDLPSEPSTIAPGIHAAGDSRQENSPSPPKDPHPTAAVAAQPPPVPEKPQRSRDPHQLYNTAMLLESQQLSVERPNNLAESMDESRLRSGRTDAVSLRSDSLKATKRRSWAASEGTTFSEADTIRRVIEEQRRGKNHYLPEITTEEQHEQPVIAEKLSPVKESPESGDYVEKPTKLDEETSSSVTSDEDQVEMEVSRRAVKGILRDANTKKPYRRIEFDPLALMLDAALEGELDLVKASAAKLTDVSSANDEGITALHNAICAGHYEIVRFLIESNADVNSQDSDGWTPLHCAASCNNLPMVRQLVEGGACVLASTLSDMETPVEKCEEDEEGYDGCLRYLAAAHSATGSLNDGKVYAAYDYDAEFEDELTFVAGDELRVISKDDKEKNWWTCERINPESSEKETGLVPRTYVSLYPALRHRKRLNFIMFDLPLEANNNEKD